MSHEKHEGPSGSYLRGDWVGVGGGRTWVLIEADPSEGFISELWQRLRSGHEASVGADFVESQIEDRSSSFGLVGQRSSQLVVVLAGRALADVVLQGTATRLLCPENLRSVEYRLEGAPERIRLSHDKASEPTQPESLAPGLPLTAGVVQADEILLDWSNPATEMSPPSSVAQTDVEQVVRSGQEGAQSEPVRQDSDQSGENEPASEGDMDTISATMRFTDVDARATAASNGDEPSHATLSASSLESQMSDGDDDPSTPIEHGVDEYHDLFGLTVDRIVEDAAVRPGEGEPVVPVIPASSNAPSLPQSSGTEHATESPAPPTPAPPSPPAGGGSPRKLIDAVPWVTSTAGVNEPPQETPIPEASLASEDLQDLTLNRAAHDALLRQLSAPGSLIQPGPTVHAIMCPAGHPNPAHASSCRVCGNSLADQTPITVPRPILGILRLSTGDVINLDRGVVLGRSPATDRLVGGERPHIVKFASPSQDISRTHLEISLDGWHVLVTDLKSTNGTTVVRPGQEPERLRPDEATLIEPGTVVSLADDASFTFEAIE